MKEGTFYNQIVRGTMKTRRIILIGVAIFQRKMSIRVMGHQRVDHQLGRSRQGKESQQKSCEYGPYSPMVSQNSL